MRRCSGTRTGSTSTLCNPSLLNGVEHIREGGKDNKVKSSVLRVEQSVVVEHVAIKVAKQKLESGRGTNHFVTIALDLKIYSTPPLTLLAVELAPHTVAALERCRCRCQQVVPIQSLLLKQHTSCDLCWCQARCANGSDGKMLI